MKFRFVRTVPLKQPVEGPVIVTHQVPEELVKLATEHGQSIQEILQSPEGLAAFLKEATNDYDSTTTAN